MIAAAISLPMSIPAGHFADRIRIRNWVGASQIIQGIVAASFIFIHSYSAFLILTIFVEVIGTGTQTLRMTLITRLSGSGEERVRFRAYLRAVTNLGIGVGATFAGISLTIDTRTAYATLVVINGATFIAAALIFFKLPDTRRNLSREAKPSVKGPRFIALRDRRYIAATMLNGVYSIHFIIQGVGIPLWIVNFTTAPRWTVSLVMLINTVACVLFSVRASKGTGDIHRAARIYFRAGLFVAAGSVIYAFAQGANPWLATTFLVVGMIFHVTGTFRLWCGLGPRVRIGPRRISRAISRSLATWLGTWRCRRPGPYNFSCGGQAKNWLVYPGRNLHCYYILISSTRAFLPIEGGLESC